jgi:hypothetical protein
MTLRAARLLVCTAALGLAAACSSSKPVRTVTVTAPPSKAGGPSSISGSAARSTPAPATSGSAGASSHLTKLNGTCDTLLPDASITEALGGTPLNGVDAFVVGKPEPTISRIAYLNCRYGVTGSGAAAKPKVEIGISLYSAADKAAARIGATADDYTAHGATAGDAKVDGLSGRLLTGGVGAGYAVPLLVVASGQRTVAVGVDPAVATGAEATTDAVALATLALQRTGG